MSRIPKKTTYHRKARKVMEQHLGRKLLPGEVVHHEDGDITNNDIENLKLFDNNIKHLDYHRENGSMKRTVNRTPATIAITSKILQLNNEGKKIREIASIVGKSKSQTHRILQKNKGGQKLSGVGTKFEIHDYQVGIPIIEKPDTWQPNVILRQKKVRFKILDRVNWSEYEFTFNDISVHLTPHKVLVFPPKIRTKISPTAAKMRADQIVLDLIPKLEAFLEIKLSNNKLHMIDITRQHTAMINEKVWAELKRIGFTKVEDEDGHTRLMLDESDGAKHIESIHPNYSDSDITRFDNLVKETVIQGHSFYQTNKAVVTTQQAVLSLNERLTKLEGKQSARVLEKMEKNPEYIG